MGLDYYALLGVPRDADDNALKKAYRKMAVKYHPDRHAKGTDEERKAAEAKFKDVSSAYEVLSDKEKRSVYDRYGEEGLRAGGGAPPPSAMPAGYHGFGGMPGGGGGVRYVFSSGPGGGGGMSSEQAEEMFRAFFGGAGGSAAGRGFDDDDDLAELLGRRGMGMGGGGMGMGGGGMPGLAEMMMGGMGGGMGSGMGGRFPGRGQRLGGSRAAAGGGGERCDVLPAGAAVEVLELSNQPALNGRKGTIERYDDARQRYHVVVDGATVALRPANVRQVVAEARVAGTSQPDLNGRVAAAATFDKASGRYRAEGLAPHTVALRPEHVVLPPRTRVEVSGVSSRPTLNGQLGAIVGADAERYTVQLPHETVRLRFGAVAAC